MVRAAPEGAPAFSRQVKAWPSRALSHFARLTATGFEPCDLNLEADALSRVFLRCRSARLPSLQRWCARLCGSDHWLRSKGEPPDRTRRRSLSIRFAAAFSSGPGLQAEV